jgi:hypothetical protein
MSDRIINSTTLPDACVRDMQVYLRTSEIVAPEAQAFKTDVLGVPCAVNCVGLGKDSSLVIIAARPVDDGASVGVSPGWIIIEPHGETSIRWNFGKCFHELPGASVEASARRGFRMRYLTLKQSLWLFVWGRDVKPVDVRNLLASAPWFDDWRRARGATDANVFFDTLGFDTRELQAVPHASWRGKNALPGGQGANTSTSGLFLWGDLAETSPIGSQIQSSELVLLTGGLATFLGAGGGGGTFTKAKVECEGGFAHLTLRLPAGDQALPSGGTFRNVAVYFSSVPYFTPQDTTVAAEAIFLLAEGIEIKINLVYPIDGDLIRAKGTFTGGVQKLLGASDPFDFPGWERTAGANQQIEVELEFSRSARELVKLSFAVEAHQQNWSLIENPPVKLDGVSFYFTVFEPLKSSRRVLAQIAFETKLGDGARALELACGGSYPSGDLFLQSRNKGIPVGNLIGKFLVGADEGLDRFVIDDLRLEYNYNSKHVRLQFAVPDKWEIVNGFKAGNLRFRIQGAAAAYEGTLSGTLTLTDVPVRLEGSYKDQGWKFTGETGAISMAKLFTGESVPSAIRTLQFDDLKVVLNTGKNKKAFHFSGKAKLAIEGQSLDIALTVEATEKEGKYDKKFHGILTLKIRQKDFKFGVDIRQVGNDTVLAFSGEVTDGVKLSDVVTDIASKLGAIQTPLNVPEALNPVLTLLSGYVNIATNDLVLSATTQSGSKLVVVVYGKKTDKKYAILIDKYLHIGLSSLPLVGDKIAEAAGKIAGVEDVGIESLQAAFTYGVRGNEADHKHDIGLLNGIIEAGEAKPRDLPRLPEAKPAKGQLGDPQFRLRATYFFADKPQPPVAFLDGAAEQAQFAPASGSSTGEGLARAQSQATWLDVQRSFGPVSVKRLGIAFVKGDVRLLLDASLAVSGLTMDLQGLSLGFPIGAITKFDRNRFLESLKTNVEGMSAKLDGLSLTYESGPIAISGGLLNVDPPPALTKFACNGQLLLKADTWALSVVGSFAQMNNGDSSLFAYGVLNATIGGPGFFFVTGIAAGFGYNRNLTLPTLNDLPDFPLIAAVTGTGNRGNLTQDIQKYVYPASGQNWLAAGVRFTSFKVIDSFALLTVFFGERFEIALLGLSTLSMPARSTTGAKPIAYAQLALEARYAPDDGVLKIAAQLTPNSYILSENCHLTGGFALYTWSQDEYEKDSSGKFVYANDDKVKKLVKGGFRSGDFVLSIGGYHPDFKPPAHYPSVPRVGANWRVNDNLTIKGSLYFALTPLAIMAGGALDANYQRGNLKAWFNSRVDFLLYWEPLYYHAHLKVSMGASYTIDWWFTTKTITAQVGADVELYGPPFGGKAVFDLYVCSFTLDFGQGPQPPQKLEWPEFESRFLPDDSKVCLARAAGGLIKELPEKQGESASWVVNSEKFAIVTSSAIPCSELPRVNGVPVADKKGRFDERGKAREAFGVKPCEVLNGRLNSQQIIEWKVKGGDAVAGVWEIESVTERLPRAAWHAPELPSVTERGESRARMLKELGEDQVTGELITGFKLIPKQPTSDPAHRTEPIRFAELPMRTREMRIPDTAWEHPAIASAGKYVADNRAEDSRYGRLSEVDTKDAATITKRGNLSHALRRQKIDLTAKPNTRYLAAAARKHELLAAPSICELGEMQPS